MNFLQCEDTPTCELSGDPNKYCTPCREAFALSNQNTLGGHRYVVHKRYNGAYNFWCIWLPTTRCIAVESCRYTQYPNEFCTRCKEDFRATDMRFGYAQYFDWKTHSGQLKFSNVQNKGTIGMITMVYYYEEVVNETSKPLPSTRIDTIFNHLRVMDELLRVCRTKETKKRKHKNIYGSIINKRGKMYKKFKQIPTDIIHMILNYIV